MRGLVVVAVLMSMALGWGGCSTNAAKLEAFCESWQVAVERTKDDCDAMGDALMTLFRENKGVDLYGALDTDEVIKARVGCAAAQVQQVRCANNPKVKAAMKTPVHEL